MPKIYQSMYSFVRESVEIGIVLPVDSSACPAGNFQGNKKPETYVVLAAMTIWANLLRQRAAECAALAKTVTDQFSQRELERTAAHWFRLADDADFIDQVCRHRDTAAAEQTEKGCFGRD
jgi:hypothetical protein